MYYLCSENKGANQLRGNRAADLRPCFAYAKSRYSHIFLLFQLCLSLAQEYDQIRGEYWNYVNRTLSSKYGPKTEITEQVS